MATSNVALKDNKLCALQGLIERRDLFGRHPVSIVPFGSRVSGVGDSEGSDLDASVDVCKLDVSKVTKEIAKEWLEELRDACLDEGIEVVKEGGLEAICPVLKIKIESLEVDVTVCNQLPIHNTKLIKAYASVCPALVWLARDVKYWAKSNSVHDPENGHLTSYAWTLLMIFYLQVKHGMGSLQDSGTREMVYSWVTREEHNVAFASPIEKTFPNGQLLEGFFKFYADEFEWGNEVVSVRTGLRLPVSAYPDLVRFTRAQREGSDQQPLAWLSEQEKATCMHIEDPFQCKRNLNRVLRRGSLEQLFSAIKLETNNGCVWSLVETRESELALARAEVERLRGLAHIESELALARNDAQLALAEVERLRGLAQIDRSRYVVPFSDKMHYSQGERLRVIRENARFWVCELPTGRTTHDNNRTKFSKDREGDLFCMVCE